MSHQLPPQGTTDRRWRVGRLFGAVAILAAVAGGVLWLGRGGDESAPPSEGPKDVAALFAAIQGNVKTRPVGGLDWATAEMKVPLRKSDLVRTYPSSSAEIKFFDETRVTVRPDSLITIEETSRDPRSTVGKVAWKVSSGEINYETTRRDSGSTEAFTPTFRLALEGNSAGTMRVGDGGLTAVAQHAGAANIETKTGEKIRLAANEGVRVDASGRAGAKQVLPEPPAPKPIGDKGVLTLLEGAPVPVAWSASSGSSQYRVIVELKTPSGLEQVYDKDQIRGTSVTVPGLGEGDYVARVAGQTFDGVYGKFAAPVAFRLVRPPRAVAPPTGSASSAAPPPPLSIEAFEARGHVLRISGKTAPGVRLLVNGIEVSVQPDGSFHEFVTLPGREQEQKITIRATSAAGGVTEEIRRLAPGQ